MNKPEVLEMVREVKEKLNKLQIPYHTYQGNDYPKQLIAMWYNGKINDALIWLDRYASTFQSPNDIKSEETEKVADVETIHNDNAKIEYRINFIKNIIDRLLKYFGGSPNQISQHALLKCIDYLYESIGYLEKMR